MGEELAGFLRDELALGGGDPSTTVQDRAKAADAAGLLGDRAHEIDACLEARVPLAGCERAVDRAAHRRIQDCHRKTTMDNADRVVEELARLRDEYRSPLFDLGASEVHGLRYRRRRQLAIEHGFDELEPAHRR